MSRHSTVATLPSNEPPNIPDDWISRLHPDLRVSFVPLPPLDSCLTMEQLQSFFGGNIRVAHELARLARMIAETSFSNGKR